MQDEKNIHSCDCDVKIQDEKNIHSCEATSSSEPRESFPRTHRMNSHFENWYPFKFKMFKEQHNIQCQNLAKVLNFTLTSPHHITQLIYLLKMVKISQSHQTKPQK